MTLRFDKARIAVGTAVVLLLSCIGPVWTNAAPLVPGHLSTVTNVQVIPSVGSLLYDPPPGLDAEALESAILTIATDVLEEEGIQAVHSSTQILVVRVYYRPSAKTPEGLYPLFIEARLEEQALLSREWDGPPPSCKKREAVWVTTWMMGLLEVVSSASEGSEQIVDAVEMIVTEFAQKVTQAKVHATSCKGDKEQEVGNGCSLDLR